MFESFLFAAILIGSVLALSFLTLVFSMRDQRRRRLLLGIQLLQAGRVLLTHIQQHRGQTIARHSGISSSLQQLDILRHQVVIDMRHMSGLDEWLADNEDWQGITRHWASLSARGRELRPEDSFSQHSRLIIALIELFESIARHHGLANSQRYLDTWSNWRDYLKLGEMVGQCRALGVQVFTSVHRDERSRQVNLLNTHLSALEQMLQSSGFLDQLSEKEQTQLLRFVTNLRAQLAMPEPNLSVMGYYQEATDAIEIVYQRFDSEMRNLHRRLVG
ncbi:hypothetical protein [Teredinibacter turnerae]|uniref:hypothetical protein n=1 Tax=Teredinibacter turnerae TaxID=2426 RepID=UPI00036EED1D|nr:hypothetical protein [Teredinibacter turnerae]